MVSAPPRIVIANDDRVLDLQRAAIIAYSTAIARTIAVRIGGIAGNGVMNQGQRAAVGEGNAAAVAAGGIATERDIGQSRAAGKDGDATAPAVVTCIRARARLRSGEISAQGAANDGQ